MSAKRFWMPESTGRLGIQIVSLSLLVATGAALGCHGNPNSTSDEAVRERSAQAARSVRQNSEKAADAVNDATHTAGRKLDQVATGVQEGWKSDRIDINSATASQLAVLPGLTKEKAEQIIHLRPYDNTHQLVERAIIPMTEYEKIQPHITAR